LTKEANGDTPTLSEIYELYDPGVVNEALDNGSIYEYRGLVYAEEA
jgi:hypothetical protein